MLRYRHISGYKYMVHEECRIAVPELGGVVIDHPYFYVKGGEMRVFKGYAWDGPSGPTLDTRSTMLPSLAHDVAYQALRAGLLGEKWKKPADRMLRRLLREAQMDWAGEGFWRRIWAEVRAQYFYVGVRLGGWWACRRRPTERQDRIFIV